MDNNLSEIEENSIVPIELWPSQIDHYQRLCNILQKWFAFLDTSPMGSGKTITTLALCVTFKLNLVVVCPVSMISVWRELSSEHGVNLKNVISYATLGGTVTKGTSHPLVARYGEEFVPTDYLRTLIKEGTLFVFDESHNLRNENTAQLRAAHVIARNVKETNSGSRVGLLSATPGDQKKHVSPLLKMLCIVANNKLYEYDQKRDKYNYLGLRELYDYSCALDKPLTNDIFTSHKSIDRKNVDKVCFDLFVGVVKDKISSGMKQIKIPHIKDAKNGFYHLPKNDIEIIRQSEALLRKATGYEDETQTITTSKISWGTLTKAQIGLERGKLRTMVRLAGETLAENPNSKVILYVWYKDSIESLKETLTKYNPLILSGDITQKDRISIIRSFQEDNLDHRLIIAHPKVGGIGVSLDDRFGKFPRFIFAIPTYNFIDLHQLTGRIYRGTTKSIATIRFIYSNSFKIETSIFNALARKTMDTKDMLYDCENIIFPGDYDKYIEEDLNFKDNIISCDAPLINE